MMAHLQEHTTAVAVAVVLVLQVTEDQIGINRAEVVKVWHQQLTEMWYIGEVVEVAATIAQVPALLHWPEEEA
jgi:hypothetical protein